MTEQRSVSITPGAKRAAIGLLALTLVMGGGNLWASWTEVHSAQRQQQHEQLLQRQAGAAVESKLCSTFSTLSALKPPPGDPEANPSRAYLQEQHDTLVQLGLDLGCKRG